MTEKVSKIPKSQLRKAHARTKRLPRLVQLRRQGAPRWVVKSEQIALVLNSRGKRHYGLAGGNRSALEERLYEKHVIPLLDEEKMDR